MTHRTGLTLHLERMIPGAQPAVYRALTDPIELATWWGPRGFSTPSVEFEPRVGGRYRITMQPPEGEDFHLVGEIVDLVPPRRLAYTFRWEPPDPDDRETLVRLALRDRGEATLIGLTQGEFATHDRLALHEAGWTESFERLGRAMSRSRR